MMAIEAPKTDPVPVEVREAVLELVDRKTGGLHPPLVATGSVVGSVCNGTTHPDEVSRAISDACAEGDLFRSREDVDEVYLGVDDAHALVTKIGAYARRADEPRQDLIGIANQRVQVLRGGGQ